MPTGVIDHVSLRGTAHPRFDLLRNATLDVIGICKQFKKQTTTTKKLKVGGEERQIAKKCLGDRHLQLKSTHTEPSLAFERVRSEAPPKRCFSEEGP